MKTLVFTFLLALVLTMNLKAQVNEKIEQYKKTPRWIEMMDDPHVNYFDAIQAFEVYWQYHKMPEGESDMDIRKVEENKKRFSKKEIRHMRQDAYMRMKIKKFIWWKERMEPFVQDDGSLMSPEQRKQLN